MGRPYRLHPNFRRPVSDFQSLKESDFPEWLQSHTWCDDTAIKPTINDRIRIRYQMQAETYTLKIAAKPLQIDIWLLLTVYRNSSSPYLTVPSPTYCLATIPHDWHSRVRNDLINSNLGPISHRFWDWYGDSSDKKAHFSYPHLCSTQNLTMLFCTGSLKFCKRRTVARDIPNRVISFLVWSAV